MQTNEAIDTFNRLDLSDSNEIKLSKKYRDKKIDHKLKKYEAIIKKLDNINRVDGDSQVRKLNHLRCTLY